MSMKDGVPVLYACSVYDLQDSALFRTAYTLVSPERQNKTDLLHFEQDKCRCVAAELLLRYAMVAEGFRQFPEIVYTEQGKPCFKTCPVQFNVSHSGDYVLCAVGTGALGCDVEKIAPERLRVAKRFSAAEYAAIMAASPDEQDTVLFRYWTLKESFLKATGLGLTLPLNNFEISLGSEITIRQTVDDNHYYFAEYADLPGYRCALCATTDCRDTVLQQIPFAQVLQTLMH